MIYLYLFIFIYIYLYFLYLFIFIYIYLYIYIFIYLFIFIYIYLYLFIFIYIYLFTRLLVLMVVYAFICRGPSTRFGSSAHQGLIRGIGPRAPPSLTARWAPMRIACERRKGLWPECLLPPPPPNGTQASSLMVPRGHLTEGYPQNPKP